MWESRSPPPFYDYDPEGRPRKQAALPSFLTPMLKQQLLSEALWLVLAALVAAAVVVPPAVSIQPYVGIAANAAVVFGFVTVLRLLFFSTASPWLRPLFMKGVAIVLAIPTFLFVVLTLNEVQTLIDSEGYAALFLQSVDTPEITTWGRYIRNEIIFFGTGLLLLLVILPFVLLVQAWRQVKSRQHTERSTARQSLR